MKLQLCQVQVCMCMLIMCYQIDIAYGVSTTPAFFSTSIFTQTAGQGHFNNAQVTTDAATTTEDPTANTTSNSFVAITFKNSGSVVKVPWYLLSVIVLTSGIKWM